MDSAGGRQRAWMHTMERLRRTSRRWGGGAGLAGGGEAPDQAPREGLLALDLQHVDHPSVRTVL